MYRLLLSSLSLLLFAGCVKEQDFIYKEVGLNSCIQEKFGNETVVLCLDSVRSDSRCPRNSNCVDQGMAEAQFIFKVEHVQHKITLATTEIYGHSSDTTISGYTIRFLDLFPYPGDPPTMPKAVVEISK